MASKFDQNPAFPSLAALADKFDHSMTVTLALDDEGSAEPRPGQPGVFAFGEDDPELATFLCVGPPVRAREVMATFGQIPDSINLRSLPLSLVQALELRLNPMALGSIRNWEFVAAHLGMTIDEIVSLRRVDNPVSTMLRKFGHTKFSQFLDIVCDMNRVDVLLSIQPIVQQLLAKYMEVPEQWEVLGGIATEDSGVLPSQSGTENSESVMACTNQNQNMMQMEAILRDTMTKFILVLHHEHKDNKNLRRFYRLFKHNLSVHAGRNNQKVVDVNDCFDERNLYGTVQKFFDRASQVVLALSVDYANFVAGEGQALGGSPIRDQRLEIKRWLHQLSNQEFLRNGCQNLRFRVVILEGTPIEMVPPGWPSNTLQYHFPQQLNQLCVRLFEDNSMSKNDPS